VRGEQGSRVSIRRLAELDDERRVPRAGQSLGNPFLVREIGALQEVRPERRVVQRDLTPMPAYMRDSDGAAKSQSVGIGPHRGYIEMKDAGENLRREGGNRNEHIAAGEHGEDETFRRVDVLLGCGEGRCAPLGGSDGGLELVHLAFEAGEHV